MANRASLDQPQLLRLPDGRLARALLLLAAGLFVAGIAVAGYVGFHHHPSGLPPVGEEAEAVIAGVFGAPDNADSSLRGDYLIERFYAVDVSSGQRYIVDFCKGKVRQVLDSRKLDGTGSYRIILERNGMQANRDRIAAFVLRQTPPDTGMSAEYLGMRLQGGNMESFAINFDGLVPAEHTDFQGPGGGNVYDYLWGQVFDDISFTGASLVSMRGTNYLLSNSELFPYFRTELKINKAMFISELFFLDATSLDSIGVYQDILDKVPPRP